MSKHIIIISNSSSNVLNFRSELIKKLINESFKVSVIVPSIDFSSEFEKKFFKLGVKTYQIFMDRAGLNPINDIRTYILLKNFFKKIKPDIVLSYTAKPIIYSGLAIGRNDKIKFFPNITGLGYGFTEKSGFKRSLVNFVLKFLYKLSLKFSTSIIFQNPDDEILFRNLGIIKKKKIFIVNGSGVDINFFTPTSLPSKPIFLMLARLVTDKGVMEYCEAAKEIRKKFPNAIFQLAGKLDPNPSGFKYGKLKEYIDKNDIEYFGHIDDVRSLLNNCRYFVLPSYREGTPRSVLEAMSVGRPIITTNTAGCRETVEDGINGLLVPIKDSKSLALAMKKMIEYNDNKINEMASESIKLVRKKYDVRKVNENIIQIINYKYQND